MKKLIWLIGCGALLALPAAAPAALIHRYSFTSDASDSVGTAHGQLVNGAAISSGGVATLDGVSQYINLPNNLLAGLNSITIEMWVTDTGSTGWARLFDFGSSTAGEDFAIGTAGTSSTRGMFVTPRTGGGIMRGSHTLTGGSAEQMADWVGTPLPQNVLKHVVWSYDAATTTARLYVDGIQVGYNTAVTIRPSDIEPTVNNWLGRSQFNDPFFKGSYSEVRIYDAALSPEQIAVNAIGGPDNTTVTPGAIQLLVVQGSSTMPPGGSQQLSLMASFANVSNVNVSGVSGVRYVSSDTNSLVVDAAGKVVAGDYGTAVIQVTYQGLSTNFTIAIAQPPQTLSHRYSFVTDANDSVGAAHGTLVGGPAFSGGAVVLSGSSQYVDLPNNLFSTNTSLTLEMWFTDTGSATWARLWDLGNSSAGEGSAGTGTSYIFMTLPSGGGLMRGCYKTTGGAEQYIDTPARPSANAKHQVVWTQDAVSQTARIYVDGLQVVQSTTFTYTPAAVGATVNNWLGRSQFSGDAYFKGSIDEFRSYDVALSAAEVMQNYQLGPDYSAQSGPAAISSQPRPLTVSERQSAVFRVDYTGVRPLTFQWYRNGVAIPGATNAAYRLASVLPADSGASFTVAVTNSVAGTVYGVLSSNALLTVVPDTIPPVALRAYNLDTQRVQVVFSEAVRPAEATNAGNFTFAAGPAVAAAVLEANAAVVTLTLDQPLVLGSNYVLSVSGIYDIAVTPNLLVGTGQVAFVATPYAPADIGGANPPGYIAVAGNGFNVTASGGSIDGTSDQAGFANQQVRGDFDVQVRLQNFPAADIWARAGLMARQSLTADSACAAVLFSPGMASEFFLTRTTTGDRAVLAGSFPANGSNTWLRLQRAGNLFTGYASYDGLNWTALASTTIAMADPVYLGFVVSSHTNGQAVTAEFRETGDTVSKTVALVANPSEPPGPCTRRTGLTFSEIMYRPSPLAGTNNLEFVEIYNSNPFFVDLGGYRLAGDVNYQFPAGTLLQGNAYLVVAADPAAVQAAYGITGVFGPYTNTLKTSGALQLRDEQNSVLLDLAYENTHPWPAAADGTGHSLVLARPSYGENDPRAWAISDRTGGSPGGPEIFRPSPLRNVLLNEVLANAGLLGEDYVELYNHDLQTNDLSGCILTDNPSTNRYVIAAGTKIGPGGFLAFYESQLGFGLKGSGDTIYLINPDGSRVLDVIRFEAQGQGVSLGRWPDGASEFYPMAHQTPGGANGNFLVHDIAINELMYHPISQNDDDQYVELLNQGTNAVDLTGWKFVAGINFTFPSNTVMAPGSFLVVARNQSNLLAHYPDSLTVANTLGDFSGRLSHNGERVALARPESNVSTNSKGKLVTNVLEVVVDEVTYADGGRWGEWADGGGSSLELVDPRSNHRAAPNWADSDESRKSSNLWTTIEATGLLDNGSNYNSQAISFVQLGTLDPGECLVDNVEVIPPAGSPNYVANPGFESGLANWSLQGCFSRSSLEPGMGIGGGAALHLRTRNRLFTLANSAQGDLNNTTLTSGVTATLRFKARWLRGCPEVMMRLAGNWLEASGVMQVPKNLGTPGAPNSRAGNRGPAIWAVTHMPALPVAGQPAVVLARAHSAYGITNLLVNYRRDSATNYSFVMMNDGGTNGDAVAGDGVFSASIPAQVENTLVAFTVTAADATGQASRFPALVDDNGPAREGIVRWGDPQPTLPFGSYHFWITASNVARWTSLPTLSNEDIDGTLVYQNRVIYNMVARYAGSPYHQAFDGPAGTRACHYNWDMPGDDKLLGHTSFNKIHWIGNDIQNDAGTANNNDSTLQREQVANQLLRGLGQPWVYRHYVAVFANGVRRGQLMEDALRPSISVPDEYFPGDSGGFLYKVQPWFEGGPAINTDKSWPWANMSWSFLMPYTTSGGLYKQARYRWSYEPRQSPDYLNNFTNLYQLVNTAISYNATNWVTLMQNTANMENWLRLMAANHAAGNWDCWGIQNGQNIYAYYSTNVGWNLFMFDFSIVLGNSISWGPGANLEAIPALDTTWQRIYSPTAGNPTFRRMYWRAQKEIATRIMLPASIEPLMDARYAAFQAAGLTATSPQPIKDWIASARASIAAQAATVDTSAFGPSVAGYTNNASQVVITGSAPLEVFSILINGIAYPVTWDSINQWRTTIGAPAGTNVVSITGLDRFGNQVAGASKQLVIVNTGATTPPENGVVFNELMANPLVPEAEYVELFNVSSNTTFDLSGWRINGLSYTFPGGALLAPRGYLVLAKNRAAYQSAYGLAAPLFGLYDGNLQGNGEVVSLVSLGAGSGQELIVDQVRYEDVAPWPTATNLGLALQVIDATRDNRRVSNWGMPSTDWRYITKTATNLTSNVTFQVFLTGLGQVFLDDIKLVQGDQPEQGGNLLVNGDFELALTNGWILPLSNQIASVSVTNVHSGNHSLLLTCTNTLTTTAVKLRQTFDPKLAASKLYTVSFWYLPSVSNVTLTVGVTPTASLQVQQPAGMAAKGTPGTNNSVAASLPDYPPLWLNEVQPQNLLGLADAAGERDPWIELYNSGTNTLSLSNYWIAATYTNLAQWAFPNDAQIEAGERLVVWLDGQPEQTTNREYHANFRLAPTNGSVAFSRVLPAGLQLVDYLNYANLPANYSYGDLPDGQPIYRQMMYQGTPGGTNSGAVAAVQVVINEWMANNTFTLTDPANGNKYSDWFELYNPGEQPADLGGYYLTDTLGSLLDRIPVGFVVPPKGYLLVWADEKPDLNTNRTDLHANFKLNQGGESIGLYAPDGQVVDAVSFGQQTNDVSEGHYPDGIGPVVFMLTPSPRAANRLAALPPATPPSLVAPAAVWGNGTFSFSLGTESGRTYQVEYIDRLGDTNWTRLEPTYTGSGNLVPVTLSLTNAPQRFFRVMVLP